MTVYHVDPAALETYVDQRELSGECRRQSWIDSQEIG